MIVSGGEGVIRFIPAYLFIDAVLNYESATSTIIDPILEKNSIEFFMEMDDEKRKALAKHHQTRA